MAPETKPKHAPGPWRVQGGVVIETESDLAVADCTGTNRWERNAVLIAAAPDMAEALLLALGFVEATDNDTLAAAIQETLVKAGVL